MSGSDTLERDTYLVRRERGLVSEETCIQM
jgi:hypothetical protein